VWAAIERWATEYVSIYYEADDDVKLDMELQEWWREICEIGHGDHANAPAQLPDDDVALDPRGPHVPRHPQQHLHLIHASIHQPPDRVKILRLIHASIHQIGPCR
jgi:hypothetical protein